ncbi:hypothetical protein Tco_1113857 [Tanacetum coccineum]|uniref:Retroviral polymerase SH3-like domain-containing protein n=1 Tax=Tanacetum coccineum TaxID=301880 RepID=A0ABQ5ITH5_9ASTR
MFVGYTLAKKAFRIYNKRTRLIIEITHVDFNELTAMASEQFSSRHGLKLLTPRTISSGLMQNIPSSTLSIIPFGVEEADHDIEVAHMDNNPYVDFPILEPSSEDSSYQMSMIDADHAGCQDTRKSTFESMQLLGDRLVNWSSKKQKTTTISSTEAECFAFAIALCCNNAQHSRSKNIDIIHDFIKEQVENGVVELSFVRTEYQLADIFTKPLA